MKPSKKQIGDACEFFGGLAARHASGERSVDASEVIEHAKVLVIQIGRLERLTVESRESKS